MKITDARVIVTCPGRNFVTLKITTEDGVTGIGDATLNGRELAVAAYLSEHVVPLLIGRSADRIEDTWQYLHKGAYWRGGPVGMSAIAAVDTALWDIKGKVAGLPLYQLLGGASRDGVTVYGHADGQTVEEAVQAADRYLRAGYKAVRVQVGVPGVGGTYGLRKGGAIYEPADSDLPSEGTWSTEKYLRHLPQALTTVRDELGFDFALLHDVHHRLTPIQAAQLGRKLEDCALYWMEDPVPAELQEGFRLIRQHTTTPIAVGEVFTSLADCRQLITDQLIDYVRATVVHAGGITNLRRILTLADVYSVKSGCHGATDISPVSLAAQVHLGMAIPNFGLQEYMGHAEETQAVFPSAYRLEGGMLHPGDAAGLGVDIDEELAAQYPYRRAYLPVGRLEDGTVHSW
jgi:mannonate dehydratase